MAEIGLVRADGADQKKPWDVVIDPNSRAVTIKHWPPLAVQPIVLIVPFATLKSIAASVLDCEVAAEEAIMKVKQGKTT